MSKIKFGVTINATPDILYRPDFDSIKKITKILTKTASSKSDLRGRRKIYSIGRS